MKIQSYGQDEIIFGFTPQLIQFDLLGFTPQLIYFDISIIPIFDCLEAEIKEALYH